MRLFQYTVCFICCLLQVHSALASVVLSGTRVVFPSNEKEVTIKLSNEGEKPGLVQVWLDMGNRDDAPQKVKVPFLLTPPLFRLDPRKGQTLRMLIMRKDLPQDKESLFWLNVLEVPPKNTEKSAEENNFIQMAFKTRIKVFYRPAQFNTPEKITKAFSELSWKVIKGANGYAVEVNNPTPYYMTVSSVKLAQSKQEAHSLNGAMVPPFQSYVIRMVGLDKPQEAHEEVQFSVINDYGSEIFLKAAFIL